MLIKHFFPGSNICIMRCPTPRSLSQRAALTGPLPEPGAATRQNAAPRLARASDGKRNLSRD